VPPAFVSGVFGLVVRHIRLFVSGLRGVVVSRSSPINQLPTHHITYQPPQPCIRCIRPFLSNAKNPAHRHTQYSLLACSAPGTHDPGHSPSPLLMPMPISRCCHAPLSLSLFLVLVLTPHESHRYIRHATPRSGSGLSTSDLITHRPRHHTLS